MTGWRWEAFDSDGRKRGEAPLTDPWSSTAGEAADMGMAHLMVRVRPDFGRLRGWRVRAWSDVGGEAWVCADEWLSVHESSDPKMVSQR